MLVNIIVKLLNKLICLLVNTCAARKKKDFLSDFFADISLSEKTHDSLVNAFQVFLHYLKFAVFD